MWQPGSLKVTVNNPDYITCGFDLTGGRPQVVHLVPAGELVGQTVVQISTPVKELPAEPRPAQFADRQLCANGRFKNGGAWRLCWRWPLFIRISMFRKQIRRKERHNPGRLYGVLNRWTPRRPDDRRTRLTRGGSCPKPSSTSPSLYHSSWVVQI